MFATSFLLVSLVFQGPFLNDGPITPRLRAEVPSSADLRVDVPLVLIPVHVTTALGASVTNLAAEQFHLFEDGVEQKITHFGSEDAPISIGVLLDSSGSMRNKIRKSTEAAAAFFKTANADDEFFLIEFGNRAKVSVPFTRDSEVICDRIAHTRALGQTSLLDAIHLALVQMKSAKNLRKAILIVSDGGDNRSRYTESEIMSAMREADVQVYAMGIFDSQDVPRKTTEERNGPRLLDELAKETGGRHFPVENVSELPALCERIGNELRNQYLIGYAPSNGTSDGKYRRVKVTLEGSEKLRAHHRQGYIAAGQ